MFMSGMEPADCNHCLMQTSYVLTVDVYQLFERWLSQLGIKRNYSSNLKSLNRYLLTKVTGSSDFPADIYMNVVSNPAGFCLDEIYNLINQIIGIEQDSGILNVKLAKGTLNDCKSAFKKYYWFLKSVQVKTRGVLPSLDIFTFGTVPNAAEIEWVDDVKKALNIKARLSTQDRINKDTSKTANFPIRIIMQLAANVESWADKLNLPSDHPSRSLKDTVDSWLEDTINNIVFLVSGNCQVRLSDIDKIGTLRISENETLVYIMIAGSGEIRQVMTRVKSGCLKPMVLSGDDGMNAIVLDHVYRMEDLLRDLADAFPFMQKLTSLIRRLEKNGVRSADTRKEVLLYIENNFNNEYADKMQELSDELKKMGKIVSLEAIYKKDNLDKH